MAARVREVVWAQSARDALDAVIEYIAQDSPQAAVQVLDDALRVGASLAMFAERGGLAAMRRDPIVEEVRRHREAIAREHGNDLDAIVAAFQREEATSGVTTVSLPPKRVVTPATRRKTAKKRRPNKRMEPTRSGSRKRAAHS
jgi:plasmid stabilization system protein ParE